MPFVAECSAMSTLVHEWLLSERCGERGVDHRERAADRTELVEVGQLEPRVFDGDSASTSIVRPGSTASANAPGAATSTNVASMPIRRHGPCRNASVPAYSWRWATMWLPVEQSANTVDASAPMPDANASDSSAPSSSAIACSNELTVGFEYRLKKSP